MIKYRIIPRSPEAHLFEVRMEVPEPDPAGQMFYMPAWIRGSYMIRDFSRNVVTITAHSADGPVTLVKTDKQTWQASACQGSLFLTYRVYAWDLSVRGAHLDTTHAYFNGPCVFLAVAGRESEICELQIVAPEGQQYANWVVATGMGSKQIDGQGYGVYQATNYEALLDYPCDISEMATSDFSVGEIRHRIMVTGRHSADPTRLSKDLAKVCMQHVQLFGELPVDDYLFLLWVVGDGYGGLEHRNSTSLMCSRGDLPTRSMSGNTEGYRRLLGLCSHEYFHLWNVKRIMPLVFQNGTLQQEVYTRQLWVFEGITSYYDDLALVRSGVINRKEYFQLLAETVTRVIRGAGRKKQTLEESSFDVWTKFYKQDENAPNAIVSYYAKGALLAMVLDLHLRLQTENACSLDTIMRYLWQHYGKTEQGLQEGEFEQIAAAVSGLELKPLFDLGVRSTQELPLEALLHEFGVELELLPAENEADKGRVVDAPSPSSTVRRVLGARTNQNNLMINLLQVFDDGAAQAAGLSAGDDIVAVDGLRLDEKQLQQRLSDCKEGDSLKVHAFRRDELMEFELIPKPAPADTCVFYLPEKLTAHQTSMQTAWLKSDGYQV